MIPQDLIRKYEEGRLTPTGLILLVLHQSRKQAVVEALELLPPPLLQQLKQFVQDYRPDVSVFHGPTPNPKTIQFVADWLANTTRPIRHSV